jgi:RNA polymerase sigma-70 factor (ECF subfamily)
MKADTDSDRTTATGQSTNSVFDALYRRCAPKVLGYVRAHGVEDPEAVTHDVFVTLLTRNGPIEGGEEGLRTLVFSIAHARCVDQHRRTARRPQMVEYDSEADTRATASAEETVIHNAAATRIRSVLDDLSEDQREALTLRVVADLTLEQAAQVMHKSVGAVKQLQRRALLNVKRHPQLPTWRA